MRRIAIFAAMLAALALSQQPAAAGDRGVGFRHFSPHRAAKLHLPHHPKFHHRGFVGKHRHFKPRHFGHFGHGGLVLKFADGDFGLTFRHRPHFKPRPFGHAHGQSDLFFRFDRPRHFRPWHDRGFAFRNPHSGHLRQFRESIPRSDAGQGGRFHGAAPPEALLRHLEQLGFRDVPELLRQRSR